MGKRAIGIIGVLVLAAAVLVGRAAFDRGGAPAVAETNPVVAPGVPVTIGSVVRADVPVFDYGIGTVQAFNTVSIESRVDGQIVSVDFHEGQEVKAGDPLFQIDPRPYQAALEQAEAAKQKDQAQLVSAQQDLNRYANLVGSGYQTRQSYDEQKATVAQLQAAIKGDAAQIDTARINLSYADIRAPISGRLGARLVDIGNLVRSAQNTVLVTITQVKPIFVSFTLPQEDLDAIRENQLKGSLVARAYSADGKTLLETGTLTLIDNTIQQATGTIHLKATFANPDERLWPGAFVGVRLIIRVRHNVPTVPSQTVEDGPDGHYVYVIKPDGTAERRVVDVASIQDGIAVVTKGLVPGDRIVVDGQYRLSDGIHVRIVPATPAPASGPAPAPATAG